MERDTREPLDTWGKWFIGILIFGLIVPSISGRKESWVQFLSAIWIFSLAIVLIYGLINIEPLKHRKRQLVYAAVIGFFIGAAAYLQPFLDFSYLPTVADYGTRMSVWGNLFVVLLYGWSAPL